MESRILNRRNFSTGIGHYPDPVSGPGQAACGSLQLPHVCAGNAPSTSLPGTGTHADRVGGDRVGQAHKSSPTKYCFDAVTGPVHPDVGATGYQFPGWNQKWPIVSASGSRLGFRVQGFAAWLSSLAFSSTRLACRAWAIELSSFCFFVYS